VLATSSRTCGCSLTTWPTDPHTWQSWYLRLPRMWEPATQPGWEWEACGYLLSSQPARYQTTPPSCGAWVSPKQFRLTWSQPITRWDASPTVTSNSPPPSPTPISSLAPSIAAISRSPPLVTTPQRSRGNESAPLPPPAQQATCSVPQAYTNDNIDTSNKSPRSPAPPTSWRTTRHGFSTCLMRLSSHTSIPPILRHNLGSCDTWRPKPVQC
jgi:hypothetical protein